MRRTTVALTTVGIGAAALYAFGRAKDEKRGTNKNQALLDRNSSEESKLDQKQSVVTSNQTREGNMGNKISSTMPMKEGFSYDPAEEKIDDRGTDQGKASQILLKIRDGAFDASSEKLALALGRPKEQIEAWARGEQTIDSDVLIKARALALERGLSIEEQL